MSSWQHDTLGLCAAVGCLVLLGSYGTASGLVRAQHRSIADTCCFAHHFGGWRCINRRTNTTQTRGRHQRRSGYLPELPGLCGVSDMLAHALQRCMSLSNQPLPQRHLDSSRSVARC
jgi:hypothetical protein